MPGTITVVNNRTYKGRGIYIGRARDPKDSVFGNPYSHLEGTLAAFHVKTREEAIEKYRDWVRQQWEENEFFRLALTDLVKDYLRGKDIVLCCWCKPEPCHGDVLKEMIEQMAELRVVTLDDDYVDEAGDLPF